MFHRIQPRPTAGRRRGLVLAGAVLVVAVLAALQAGRASALGEQCSGEDIQGIGALLQEKAESLWSGGEEGFNNNSGNSLACSGTQGSGGKPEVSFTAVGSAAALHEWGADDGVMHGEERNFIATDIAPAGPVGEEGTQLARIKKAIGSDVVVVPVAQTAIAIVAHPPELPAHSQCSVSELNAEQLQEVFSGEITNWRQLNNASDQDPGGNCDQAITRVVREESAGVTYQLKHYFSQVDSEALPCSGEAKRTWAQLQAPFGGETPPNTEWPRKSQCQEGEGPVTTVTGSVGEAEAGPLNFVEENAGTITYASLPGAWQYAPERIVPIYNGEQFAYPWTGSDEANCEAAEYTLPEGTEAGLNVDWSETYGSDPSIGEVSNSAYPICTLTFDLVAADSVGVFGEGVATTLADYHRFLIDPEAGQAAVKHARYQELPAEVLVAAAMAVLKIDGEEEEGEEEEGGGGSGAVLCKVSPEAEAGTLTCPAGEGFAGEVTGELVAETTATFESTAGLEGTISCTKASYAGDFDEDGNSAAEGGIASLGFGDESTPCSSTLAGEPEPVLYLSNLPYGASRFVYLGGLAPQGAFVLAKEKGGNVALAVSGLGEGEVSCYFKPSFLSGQVVNGSPTKMLVQGSWQLTEGIEACPEAMQQSAQLTVTRTAEGQPLYIAGE